MRVALPVVNAAGFGNNVVPLAKAHLVAEAAGLEFCRPRWPACRHVPGSPRGYERFFPVSTRDRVVNRMVHAQLDGRSPVGRVLRAPLPVRTFSRGDYQSIGEPDIAAATPIFMERNGVGPDDRVAIAMAGQWGRYRAIRHARDWVRELMGSPPETAAMRRELEDEISARGAQLAVGVNVRMGEFPAQESLDGIQPGERLVQLPFAWFVNVCRAIREVCDATFVLVSDGTREQLQPFIDEFDPVHRLGVPYTDLVGCLVLANAALLVSANSTYSRLAAFLSDRPYIWCSDTLFSDDSGELGYLWSEAHNDPLGTSRSGRAAQRDPDAIHRCFALPARFRQLPPGLVRYLRSTGQASIEDGSDMLYGDAVYCPVT